MQFSVVEKERCDLPHCFEDGAKRLLLLTTASINADSYDGQGTEEDQNLYQRFMAAFHRQFGERFWTVSLNLQPLPVFSRGPFQNTRQITLKGQVFEKLHQVVCHDNPTAQFKIKFEAVCQPEEISEQAHSRATEQTVASLTAEDFAPKVDEDGTVDHSTYVQRRVTIPTLNHPSRYSWTVNIKIVTTDFVCLDEILPKNVDSIKNIFAERKFCDFTITSEDGTRIPCHRVFLAKSPVLLSMLEGSFEEARTHEMEMTEMTTRGVNALLEYFYCDDVHQAIEHSDIALELLKAADVYDMPVLWTAMTTILGDRSHSWYDVDVALKLFDFVSKCNREESPRLRRKMIQVLALKPEQLSRSTLFVELFRTPMSREIINLALEANRP